MRYRLVELDQVKQRASAMWVRDRARYDEIKRDLRNDPYPRPGDKAIRQLDFDDGLSIYSYVIPSFQHSVIYTVLEPDPGEELGVVRIVSLIDRRAEQRR